MPAGTDDRTYLERDLAHILGFDDGASDVFDHLTQIAVEDDLRDYLGELLGPAISNKREARDMVQNIVRFNKGEPIVRTRIDNAEQQGVESKTSSTATEKRNDRPNDVPGKPVSCGSKAGKLTKRQEKEHTSQQQAPTSKGPKETKSQAEGGPRGAPSTKLEDQLKKSAKKKPQAQARVSKRAASSTATTANTSTARDRKFPSATAQGRDSRKNAVTGSGSSTASSKPLPPIRGKAKSSCGCWGSVHKCLTNCLHCGRIACEEEGYGYCPFCGYLIEEISIPESGEVDSATLHKERLLKFDQEFARRTIVYDDQSDYFSNSTSPWLNEDERRHAEEQDRKQRSDMHERKAPRLNIAFD